MGHAGAIIAGGKARRKTRRAFRSAGFVVADSPAGLGRCRHESPESRLKAETPKKKDQEERSCHNATPSASSSATSPDYIAELYEKYAKNPGSVDESWAALFGTLGDEGKLLIQELKAPAGRPRRKIVGRPVDAREHR